MLAAQEESGVLFRYRFGDTEFDEARFELRVDGVTIEVQPKPLELLALLLRTPGEVVTSEEILQSVWKYQNPGALETNVIGTALTKLRNALGKDARRIVNLPRVGYRFEGRVERVVVGRTLTSGLALEPGITVPLRPNFVLRELLSRSRYSEVWRAGHAKTGEPRIYKFSPAGDRLPALKREATLFRVLHDALGERADFVRVIDWNFTEAPFFLECEDGGQNLRKWAEEDGRLAGTSMQQRIELVLQIADAVAAAHSVGVLHKDLKPDNVLIAPAGEGWQVKLTDFGSGQLLEPARLEDLGITMLGFTATQSVAGDATTGTLLYMAPELARGEPPTTQSDVYALGLLLYQMVIGDMRRPLVPGWQREVSDELLQQDIAAATDGNPAHRLTSVAELARRLRHISGRRAELARRRQLEQLAQQAQEELKRTRARRPWLLALVASLVVGCAVSSALFYQSHRAYLAAEEQRTRAEAINRFLNDDLLGAADPTGPGAQRDPTVKVLLEKAAGRLESRFNDTPETKASIDLAIGQAYFGLTDYAAAEIFQKRGIAQLVAKKGAGDSDTLEAEYALARTLGYEGRFAEIGELLDGADRSAGERLQQASRLSLIAAWARGNYHLMQMQADLALPYFERAEDVRARIMPEDDAWLVRSRNSLAWCYVRLGRNKDALDNLEQLMKPAYSLENIGALDWQKMRLQYALALMNLSRFEESESMLKDSLREVRQVLGDDNYTTGLVWDYLAQVYEDTAHWSQAIEARTQAYAIMRKSIGDEARGTLATASELAIDRYLSSGAKETLPGLQSTHAALLNRLGANSAFTQEAAFYLASALTDLERPAEAAGLLEGLEAPALNAVDPQVDWPARIAGLRGMILVHQGQHAQGRPMIEQAAAKLATENAPSWMQRPLQLALDGEAGTKLVRK